MEVAVVVLALAGAEVEKARRLAALAMGVERRVVMAFMVEVG